MGKKTMLGTLSCMFLGVALIFSASTASAASKKEVAIGYQLGAQLHQWLHPISEAKGWYKEAGFTVKSQQYADVGIMAQHLAVGEMDIGLMGLTAVMIIKARGGDAIIVGAQNQGGSFLCTANHIHKFEDLKDQPVGHPGVAAVQHAFLTKYTEIYKTPVKMITVKPTDMAMFAQKKEVTAVQIYEPFCSMVNSAVPGWKRLIAVTDILPGTQCCVIATSKKFAKQHPDIVQAILDLNAKTTRFYRESPDETIAILAKAQGLDPVLMKEAYKNVIAPWPPVVDAKTAKTQLEWMMAGNKIDPKLIQPSLDAWWNDLYDSSFEKKMKLQ
jgi:taurine transport system substrate-binding protein